MVRPLDERKPRDDLRRVGGARARSTRRRCRRARRRHQPEIALRGGDGCDHRAGAACAFSGTVKPKWKRAESRTSASLAGHVRVHRERRLHKVKVEMMTRQMLSTVSSGRSRDGARPGGASSRPRARAGRRRPNSCVRLTSIRRFDDLAALDQQRRASRRRCDRSPARSSASVGSPPRRGSVLRVSAWLSLFVSGDVIAVARAERKENIDRVSPRFLALAPRTAKFAHTVQQGQLRTSGSKGH